MLVRREPLHPGAQQTFDDIDGQRYTAFVTDQPDVDIAELARRMCAHARVEQRIRDQKQTGWQQLPSHDFAVSTVWCQLAMIASNLLVRLGVLGRTAGGLQHPWRAGSTDAQLFQEHQERPRP